MNRYSVVLIVLLFACSSSEARMYKYVDENGTIHITNAPTEIKYKPTSGNKRKDKVTRKSANQKECEPMIDILAKKYSVDPALIKAVIKAESDFNPKAVSKKGARGLMQLVPATADRLDVGDPFNMRENMEGGVKHLKYLLDLFNDNIIFAVAAYNAGENAVKKYQTIPPYPETQNYVRKVLTYYHTYSR